MSQRQFQTHPQVRVVTEIGKLDFNFLRRGVVTVRSMSGGPDYDGPLTINRGTYASLWADVYRNDRGEWSVARRDMYGPLEKPLSEPARVKAGEVILATIERLLAADPALELRGERADLSNRIRGLEDVVSKLSAELAAKESELAALMDAELDLILEGESL